MIGSLIEDSFPALKAEAESLLVDRCRMERKTGRRTVDPVTKATADEWQAYAKDVPCRLRRSGNVQQAALAGGASLTTLPATLSISIDGPDVDIDHRAVITASRDASAIGKHLYVQSVPRGSEMVLRRLLVSEVQ